MLPKIDLYQNLISSFLFEIWVKLCDIHTLKLFLNFYFSYWSNRWWISNMNTSHSSNQICGETHSDESKRLQLSAALRVALWISFDYLNITRKYYGWVLSLRTAHLLHLAPLRNSSWKIAFCTHGLQTLFLNRLLMIHRGRDRSCTLLIHVFFWVLKEGGEGIQ